MGKRKKRVSPPQIVKEEEHDGSQNVGQLAPYELQRLEIMARNRKRLEELGVLEAVRDLEALPKPEPKPKKPRHVAAVKTEAPTEPTRRSRRLQSQSAEKSRGRGARSAGFTIKQEDNGEGDEQGGEEEAEQEEEQPIRTPKREKKSAAAKAVSLEDKLKELEMNGLYEMTDAHAKFVVLGSKGNHYIITLKDNGHSCQCMDHRIRRRQCKHITLVLNSIGAGNGAGEWRQAMESREAGTQDTMVSSQYKGLKLEKAEPLVSVAHNFL